MTDIIHTETYGGYTIEIIADQDPPNPRTENDNASTMYCCHGRYSLGDKQYSNPDEVFSDMIDACGVETAGSVGELPAIVLPLYLYDHSGITISTTPFACRWDSGQVGYVMMTYAEIHKAFHSGTCPDGFKPTPDIVEKVEQLIRAEVSEYDDYLTGNCYGYRVYPEGSDPDEEGESCYGIFGSYEKNALTQAKEAIDALA